MIVTTQQLQEKYSHLSNKMAKISRDIRLNETRVW